MYRKKNLNPDLHEPRDIVITPNKTLDIYGPSRFERRNPFTFDFFVRLPNKKASMIDEVLEKAYRSSDDKTYSQLLSDSNIKWDGSGSELEFLRLLNEYDTNNERGRMSKREITRLLNKFLITYKGEKEFYLDSWVRVAKKWNVPQPVITVYEIMGLLELLKEDEDE